ncbi:MAG: M48 family metallopeptidase [Campylobacterota bacterium]|nr:M48 family metallopeptidase [Campylobacterota bacterium]
MCKFYKSVLFLTLVAIIFTGCAYSSSTQKGVVGVDRKQLMLVSSANMDKGAKEAYSSIIQKAKQEGTLNQNKKNALRIKEIAKNLIPQTPTFRQDAKSWDWEANLITSKQLNAWCMPGGKIAFYSGIIDQLQLSDDEIAAIMGHEMAHALREHSRERSSQNMVANGILGIGAALLGLDQGTTNLAAQVTNVTILLPNSREQESEADYMGVELAARAGYDPRAAISVWEKMKKLSNGNNPPEFLSTHPSHDTRIEELTAYAEVVRPLYEQSLKQKAK